MQYSAGLLALASLVAANAATELKHGSSFSNSMGPVTFLFPETRQWTADNDNIAPCGSTAGVGNRSDFPLDNGFIAFVAKYISTEVKLSISYKSNPTSQTDFQDFYSGNVTDELHIGHTCFYMPDQPSNIAAGDVATIQVIYQNDDEDALGDDGPVETSTNQTFYACADIKFVEESVFDVTDYALACFNSTNDNYYAESSIQTTSASRDASASAQISSARSSAGLAASTNTVSTTATSSSGSSSSSTGVAAALYANPVVGVLGAAALALNFI